MYRQLSLRAVSLSSSSKLETRLGRKETRLGAASERRNIIRRIQRGSDMEYNLPHLRQDPDDHGNDEDEEYGWMLALMLHE